ncbi:hypothetical protein OSTOST_19098 [Ostertagia ostertagi]
MWTQIIALAIIVGSAQGAVLVQPTKLGQRIELNLGHDVSTWHRRTKDGEQTMKRCSASETDPKCSAFTKKTSWLSFVLSYMGHCVRESRKGAMRSYHQ